jgi:hypothetical protein
MGQYVAGHIVKSLVVHLFKQYEVHLLEENESKDNSDADKNSWTPKSEAMLRLTARKNAP